MLSSFRQVEHLVSAHFTVWVQQLNSHLAHRHLAFADSIMSSDYLSIYICQTDIVVIDDIESTNTSSSECLHHVTSDAANAKYRNSAAL